ncbi:OmpA family protein [Galbibacter sp. EGI 63066]|uniref:OmpA family protein n=1 Tax=Galbibacter sp. EGI 63066 TaxID=2993559 RepID=UPI002248FE23|nr:OmpA family protein [Galbibacter sp. EGI 63066]MCX2678367.1 OmpA family protein [Galbibacter sp. EGI 63066]
MRHKYRRYIALLFFSFMLMGSYSQERKMQKAYKKYNQLAFINASEIYEEVAQKGYRSAELFKKLGNTYYFNARYQEASKWYGELFGMEETVEGVYYLRYAQTLKATGKDKQAREFFDTYIEKAGIEKEGLLTASDYLKIIEKNSGRYDMETLPFNTDGIDFGVAIGNGKLLFASTRDTGTVLKRKSAWDGLTFLDLYEVPVNDNGEYGDIKKLEGGVNTRFHESSPCITRDGKTMYFTRNNTTPGMTKEKDQTKHLKIYRASFKEGRWGNIEDLSINGDHYSTAHPALSPAEDKLYFISDRPEAIGATDIFMTAIHADGSLGKVENLGEKINTKGRESFPYVTARNELYFSSDGHFGLGGYDVFYVQFKNNGPGNLINTGRPVNSEMDDFAFTIDTETHKGYVSSNRPEGKGYDDIYAFTEHKDIRDLLRSRIYGQVRDKDTKEPLAGSIITLLDHETGAEEITTHTDSLGNYEVETDRFVSYRVRASREQYSTDETFAPEGKEEQELNFELKRNEYDLLEGDNLAVMLGIKDIYFDFDKWNIRPDAEVELQKILVVMKKYPQLRIDIRSHTDSRGDDAYNLLLSDRRARSTMQYLIDRGIALGRLSSKGYGESELLNKCVNGIKCSEEEHQQNRRSEFIASKL